jgi:DNA-binding GntR family transcriptional regulator
MMGVSRQSVNAALHELEADGVLKMSYGRIYLLKRLR